MSGTDDAGDQVGPTDVVALHRLVPAAEELDLIEELRADQDRHDLELFATDRQHPDWVEPPDPQDPEPDPKSDCCSSRDARLTQTQALGLVAHVLGGKPLPPEGPPPTLDRSVAASPNGPESSEESGMREDAEGQDAARWPLSPHYWALRKMLHDAGVELLPTDRDLAPSAHELDDDER